MKIKIAAAGELPDNDIVLKNLDTVFSRILKHTDPGSEYGTEILISPLYDGQSWIKWIKRHNCDFFSFTSSGCPLISGAGHEWETDTHFRNIAGNEICRRADISIAVWNGDPYDSSGATWEYIQTAHDMCVPCIWISSDTGNVYCVGDSYYRRFSDEYLSEMLCSFSDDELTPDLPKDKIDPITSFWIRRRSEYLKKHKADAAEFLNIGDTLLSEDHSVEKQIMGGEAIRKHLLGRFISFDRAALDFSSRYQAILYQRSVLPFAATIFLAAGFYIEYIIGLPLIYLFPHISHEIAMTMSAAAGIGFLINACIMLYVYRLSASPETSALHNGFVRSRCVAEILRVALHFIPYGLELDPALLSGIDPRLCMQIRHLCDENCPQKISNNKEVFGYVLQHCREMLTDQLIYHERSMKRYGAIVHSLEKRKKIFLCIGTVSVISSGILQFILLLPPVKEAMGDDMKNVFCSLLNTLSMVFSSWSEYFSSKLDINNFNFNYQNHKYMWERLNILLKRTDRLISNNDISAEVTRKLFDDTARLILKEDLTEWILNYQKKNITPI